VIRVALPFALLLALVPVGAGRPHPLALDTCTVSGIPARYCTFR
jgi:hypothetical protein